MGPHLLLFSIAAVCFWMVGRVGNCGFGNVTCGGGEGIGLAGAGCMTVGGWEGFIVEGWLIC